MQPGEERGSLICSRLALGLATMGTGLHSRLPASLESHGVDASSWPSYEILGPVSHSDSSGEGGEALRH